MVAVTDQLKPLDLAAVRARAAAARELVTRLKLAGNITDVGGAEALYIVVGDLEATLSRFESADRLHRADHARVAELERERDRLKVERDAARARAAKLESTIQNQAAAILRLIARVAELEAALDDVPEHIIQVRATTFTLKHPLSCRPNLFDCPFNEAGRDLDGPPAPLGCYVVTLDAAGGLIIGEAVDG